MGIAPSPRTCWRTTSTGRRRNTNRPVPCPTTAA
jgi:hypothetical protein